MGVKGALAAIGFSCRDDSNDLIIGAIAVANDECPKRRAEAKEHEAFFLCRMVGIVDEQAKFVSEGGLGLLERNAMLALVGVVLCLISLEPQFGQPYIRITE